MSNFSIYQTRIEEEIERLDETGMTVADLVPGAALTSEILKEIGPDLIALMRRNTVTGVFLVFEGPESAPADGMPQSKSGIYLRDLDPINNPCDNSDLLMERSPTDVAQSLGIAMDANWSPRFEIGEECYYYNNPVQAIRETPELSGEDAGYWGLWHDAGRGLDQNDHLYPAVGFQRSNGAGRAGHLLSDDYLKTPPLSKEPLADQSGSYMLAILDASRPQSEGLTLRKVTHSGGIFIAMFGEEEELVFSREDADVIPAR